MAKWISYLLTRLVVGLFGWVPFRLLYPLSDGLSYVLMNVVGYRKAVVLSNLKRCFPEKTDHELVEIARESYRNLTDLILESLKAGTMPLSEIHRRFRYVNYELVNEVLDQGRSVVLAGGHYNNWEWGVVTIAAGFHGNTIGVYKPLSNPLTDRWFYQNRSRDGRIILKSMRDTFRAVEEFKGQPSVFILVADQVPSNRKTAIPAWFFKQPTACLPGTEAIARSNNYPVFMYEIQRIKRGYYELTFSEICREPAALEAGALTQELMRAIEATIRQKPANWLWSHKRWKWQPEMEGTPQG